MNDVTTIEERLQRRIDSLTPAMRLEMAMRLMDAGLEIALAGEMSQRGLSIQEAQRRLFLQRFESELPSETIAVVLARLAVADRSGAA